MGDREPWSDSKARATEGIMLGALGVLGFSFTLPATRIAVSQLDGTVVGLGRAVVATALALAWLGIRREAVPPRRLWARIGIVGGGVVIGFPFFSALALQHLTSAHSAVIVGLLPAATAVMAVVRAGERPTPGFWIACAFGLASVLAFAATEGAGTVQAADLLVLIAVVLGALGYAEGGALSRELGGWRVICWALVASLPVSVPAVVVAAGRGGISAGTAAWLGFAYVSVVSMFLAFFPWYRGLAIGGVARIAQVQLAQPVLTLVWSALLIGEPVGATTIAAALLVLASVAVTQRTAVRPASAIAGTHGTGGPCRAGEERQTTERKVE
ncbi:MAG TPA: DMT family transporter [bacterium]|nr:DMT family transporter [bacterium]